MPVFGQKPDTGHSPVRRRGSLWRVFAYFLHGEKVGCRRRRDDGAKSRRKRRIRRRLEVSPLRRGREQDEVYFAPAGATFFRSAAKEGKDAPEGTYFEAVPSGLPPRRPRGLRPPLDSLGFTGDEGRGTRDCPLRRGRRQDEGCFAPAGATFFRCAAKEGKGAPGEPRRNTRRSLRFRRTVILRKLRIARWFLLFKSKRFVSI